MRAFGHLFLIGAVSVMHEQWDCLSNEIPTCGWLGKGDGSIGLAPLSDLDRLHNEHIQCCEKVRQLGECHSS